MKNLIGSFPKTTKKLVLILLIASPWLIVQVGIFVLAPDKEFDTIPVCADDSGNCAHLGGGDDYRLNEQYSSIINLTADVVYDNLNDYLDDNAWDILIDESTDGTHYVHFVEVTPFWLFPDDVVGKGQSPLYFVYKQLPTSNVSAGTTHMKRILRLDGTVTGSV